MSSDVKHTSLIASTGDESFEAIFTRYYPLVYQLALSLHWPGDEADDIAQEVFCATTVCRRRQHSEGERRGWLCRVATNLSLNALRSRQRRTHHEERATGIVRAGRAEEVRHSPVLSSTCWRLSKQRWCGKCWRSLPERQQTYLLLRSIGLSYAEIAQATGVAPASVGSLLARAEREFRRKYYERARTTAE